MNLVLFTSCSLVRTDIMDELVSLITKEPSGDVDEQLQYKLPNMACELLTSDVGAISDKLADTEVSTEILLVIISP